MARTTHVGRLLQAAFFILMIAGCARSTEKAPGSGPVDGGSAAGTVPAGAPSIRGIVTAIGPGRTLRIEENPFLEAGSAKAQVRVPEDALISEVSGASRRFEDIREGHIVSAWFDGPVAESYPVQATAHTLLIDPGAAHDTTVDVHGYGPVRPGMTAAEAEQALGVRLVSLGPEMEPCRYVHVEGRRELAFMLIDGRIARVDVQGGTVKTAEGAGIGDTEERIHALYPERVEVQPHKYVDGHYLIVRPAAGADTSYRIVFETDGRRVTRYRAGRLPEVRWVEGCS